MDTTKHLEVARAAHDKWLYNSPRSYIGPNIIVAELDSKRLLCTEVERGLIDAACRYYIILGGDPGRLGEYTDAIGALAAEREGKPVEPAPSEADALRAEIATLKERLAEATKPRKVWHEAEQSRINPQGWRVFRHTDERRREGEALKDEVLHVIGDAAESIARAHAAKLDAEQGGQS